MLSITLYPLGRKNPADFGHIKCDTAKIRRTCNSRISRRVTPTGQSALGLLLPVCLIVRVLISHPCGPGYSRARPVSARGPRLGNLHQPALSL